MELTPLQRQLSEESYLDVERLLDRLVTQFLAQDTFQVPAGPPYQQRRQEYLSAAREFYCQAYQEFDPRRGVLFSNWVAFKVTRALARYRRGEAKRLALIKQTALPDDPRPETFRMEEFLLCLSDDARLAAQSVLSPNLDVRMHLTHFGYTERTAQTQTLRRALVGFLRELGWTAARIAESFDEIREALS